MTRLGTLRNQGEVVAIEQDKDGYLWLIGKGDEVSFKMPACLADAEDFFRDLNRGFDPSRLPVAYKSFWPGVAA